jgi:methylglutamate dehydrogenase subunit B
MSGERGRSPRATDALAAAAPGCRVLIECPFCGPRDGAEFEFRSTVAPGGVSAAQRLYLRRADPARSIEHWQHLRGCRAWLVLTRDLASDEVLEVCVAGRMPPPETNA